MMVIDALQSYAQLASGLTKTTREKAVATAKGLLEQAGLGEVAADAGDRVSKLADELLATSKANRQLLTQFVDAEVQKAVTRLGLAKSETSRTFVPRSQPSGRSMLPPWRPPRPNRS